MKSHLQCRRHRRCRLDPWLRKMPWRTAWQSTAVHLSQEFHAHRSLVGYSPWGCKESERTEWISSRLGTQRNRGHCTMQKVQITIKLTRLGNLCQIQKQEVLLLPGCTFSLQPHLSCWKYAFALSSGSREEEEQASRNLTGFSLWITRPPHGDPSPDLCL